MALPVVAASRQQIMAVSVLACERVLADLDGRPLPLEEQSRAVLAQVPHAAQWARSFTARSFARAVPTSPQAFRQRSAPFIVHAAVEGIAQAYIPQPDQMLRDLLIGAIGQCAPQAGRAPRRDTAIAAAACAFTSTAAVCRREARPAADHERSPAPGSVMRALPPICVPGWVGPVAGTV